MASGIDEILVNAGLIETRVALVAGGELVDLFVEPGLAVGESAGAVVGRIHLGRVTRVTGGMQAAFVDIGAPRAGFLSAREAQVLAGSAEATGEGLRPIAQCVHEGQAVMVQAIKGPLGEKGIRLSADIALPGPHLVYAPLRRGVSVSRHISDPAERRRLRVAVESLMTDRQAGAIQAGAIIVRTAAAGATGDALAAEAMALRAEWQRLQGAAREASPPACLSEDPGPVVRVLRDRLSPSVRRVAIDDGGVLAEARGYCARSLPAWSDRLELHSGPSPLYDAYDLEAQIEAAMQPRVALPSGGSITIEGTEAMTVVDVNSGGFVDIGGRDETILRTNLEAAAVIARQLRLRRIGGIVVIDFIDMARGGHARRVLDTLAAAFAGDRAAVRIDGMSRLGLVEMTRKRTGESLNDFLTEPCGDCEGRGRRPTVAAVAARIERQVMREAAFGMPGPLAVRASPEVAAWLGDAAIAGPEGLGGRLSRRSGRAVAIRAEAGWPRERFEIGGG